MGDMVDRVAHAQELSGWWIIPIGLVCGIGVILATTLVLRCLLRFALPPRAARLMWVKSPLIHQKLLPRRLSWPTTFFEQAIMTLMGLIFGRLQRVAARDTGALQCIRVQEYRCTQVGLSAVNAIGQ
jgi:hypothetical protein